MIHTPLDRDEYQLRQALLRMSRAGNGSDERAQEVEERTNFNLIRRVGVENQNQLYPPQKLEAKNATTRQHHFKPVTEFQEAEPQPRRSHSKIGLGLKNLSKSKNISPIKQTPTVDHYVTPVKGQKEATE